MAKGLAFVDVEALITKDMLLSLKHSMGHCGVLFHGEEFSKFNLLSPLTFKVSGHVT